MSVVGSFPVLTRVLFTGQTGTGDLIACVSGTAVDLDCCNLYGNANGDYTSCLSGQLGVVPLGSIISNNEQLVSRLKTEGQ